MIMAKSGSNTDQKKLVRHLDEVPPDRRATATYNFVPLPDKAFVSSEPMPDRSFLSPERLHGLIELTIRTETELYTRAAYPPAEDSKEVVESELRQAFYHHGVAAHPVIPGSTLRGAIRNLVEILGHAHLTRFSVKHSGRRAERIRDETLVYRAVADQSSPPGRQYNTKTFLPPIGRPDLKHFDYPSPRVRAGYLDVGADGAWSIRPARQHQGTSFIRVHLNLIRSAAIELTHNSVIAGVWVAPARPELHPVGKNSPFRLRYAKSTALAKEPRSELVRGTLVQSGEATKRTMHAVVYEQDHERPLILVPDDIKRAFEDDRDMQRGIACRKVRSSGDPLFYLVDAKEQLVFLGPTTFFRIPYPHRTGEYADVHAADDGLDLAESIFGTMTRGQDARRGRVEFEDAQLGGDQADPFLGGAENGHRWPSILATPKPTSYQNYLVQTAPEKDELKSYIDDPVKETVVRGFKRYWHRGSAATDLHVRPPADKNKTQFTRIRPVRPGVHFQSRIHFENLTELELGALLASIELPSGARHHLGMGKPLGLGTIRLEGRTRLVNPVQRWLALDADGFIPDPENEDRLRRARAAFERAMLQHHVQTSGPPADTLWAIPRLDALRRLLEWDQKPGRKETLSPDPTIDGRRARERRVLPAPSDILLGPLESPSNLPPRDPASASASAEAPESEPPVIGELRALLDGEDVSAGEKLKAVEGPLLVQLEALPVGGRRDAWSLIAKAITENKKTRDARTRIRMRLLPEPP